MHQSILQSRFTIKAIPTGDRRPIELEDTIKPHPLSYMELPLDPEYSLYNGRLTPEVLNNVTDDEQYWAVRQKVVFRNTGELPLQIAGPDAEKFADFVFARDVNSVQIGRCSYNFALYPDGSIITDGILLRLAEDQFWMAQADGELSKWYRAHIGDLDVTISDPDVWITQIQGPKAMHVLRDVIEDGLPYPWRYFDIAEVQIAGETVLISRTGFSNELGWEFYLRPENDAEKIGAAIWDAGQAYGMLLTGTPAFRARRIEAGLLTQADFNNGTTPFQAGLGKFMRMEKPNFIGRKALLSADRRSQTFGLRTRGGIAKRGRYLKLKGTVIGHITSSTWSPFQQCGVAIVRIDNQEMQPGTEFDVICIDGSTRQAQLCTLPMYDAAREIVRGKTAISPKGPEPWNG